MYSVKYLTPRESLGRFLSNQNYPSMGWAYVNPEQEEYWYKKADEILDFIKRHGLV